MLRPLAAAALLLATPATADPLRDRLIADARAVPPAALAFERHVRQEQAGGGDRKVETRVDRWDGRRWTVLSENGAPPAPRQAAKLARQAAKQPTPGYHRIADYLASGAVRGADALGRTIYTVAKLPPGTLTMGGDSSDRFTATLVVEDGPRPFVREARLAAKAPFRMAMVAKVARFDLVNEYRLGLAGRPEQVRQRIEMAGSLFGREGTMRTETRFVWPGGAAATN